MSEAISGEKHHFYGKEHTEETKQKMSEAQKGKTLSDETKNEIDLIFNELLKVVGE